MVKAKRPPTSGEHIELLVRTPRPSLSFAAGMLAVAVVLMVSPRASGAAASLIFGGVLLFEAAIIAYLFVYAIRPRPLVLDDAVRLRGKVVPASTITQISWRGRTATVSSKSRRRAAIFSLRGIESEVAADRERVDRWSAQHRISVV